MSCVPADEIMGQEQSAGGYDADFCDELDEDYTCSICMLAFRDPQQIVVCGHQYCKSCLESCRKAQGGEFRCPQDRQLIDMNKVFPNVASERKILSLRVKCSNKECEWTSELRSLKGHIDTCQFVEIRCLSEGCESFHQRRFLIDHLQECIFRIVKCPYCEEEHTQKGEKEHRQICTGIPTECGNGCGEILPKKEIQKHLDNDCPLQTVSCAYLSVGCQHKCTRDKRGDHEKNEVTYHLNLAMNRIRAIEHRFEESKKVCVPPDIKRGIVTYIWKIENFERTMDELSASDKCVNSDHYLTSEYGYEVRLIANVFSADVYRGGQWSSTLCLKVELGIMKGSYDALLKWPFSYKYTLSLIHQDDESPNIVRTKSALMIPVDEIVQKGYAVNNTIFIKLELYTNFDK